MKNIPLYLAWLASVAHAQSSSQLVVTLSSARSLSDGEFGVAPTVPSAFEGSSIVSTTTSSVSGSATSNATVTSSSSTTRESYIVIGGGTTTTGNTTASSTSAAPRASNTQPCNNYAEFCTRKYSNITEVAAHNSPFVHVNNAGSNQQYGVTQQLNDGIRVLQGQAHNVNGTLHYCHTSCDLLDMGPVEDYLRDVTEWLEAHPFEVLTIIFGNYDWQKTGSEEVTSENFVAPVENSGLMPYIYQPPNTAMTLDDWPTLGELILNQKRVIAFIDYKSNTTAVPWLLWEFYNVWETPFSPTNVSFPCNIDRPDGLSDDRARDMLYMANHNLNVQVEIGSFDLLIPNTATLNVTNGVEGLGSLGNMSEECTADWGRPPNFLLVDYYNFGSPMNGSVFEVAAQANGVTYNRDCCGLTTASLASPLLKPTTTTWVALVVAIVATMVL